MCLVTAFSSITEKNRAADRGVYVRRVIEVSHPHPHDIHTPVLAAVAVEVVAGFERNILVEEIFEPPQKLVPAVDDGG
jgi:hypothetical protein